MLKFSSTDFISIESVLGRSDFPEVVAEMAQSKFDSWLAKQPRIYSTTANNTLWMKWSNGNKPVGYEASGYLIVEEKCPTS